MNNKYSRAGIALITMLGFLSIANAQNNCNPTVAVDSASYEGIAFFNYGSTSKTKSQKYQTAFALGQVFTGYVDNSSYSSTVGFYGRYLLPPFALKVNATQGDLLDRIQLSWEIDALGPSPNEGFNIYRDGIFLASVGPNIRNYNDFNVIAGVAYQYSVRGLNAYGEGNESYALGFQVPNGVVTGWIKTQSGSPVPNAQVTLMPMQGFSAKFDAADAATASVNNDSSFIPDHADWTMTFYIKTSSANANASVISIGEILLYVRAKNSSSGHEGIELASLPSAPAFLAADFVDSLKNEWNHVTISYEEVTKLMRLYINGVLVGQAPFNDNVPVGEEVTNEVFFKLGNTENGGGWNGKIDELRIYSTLLTELDIPEIMHGTASSQTPNLDFYWKMDEELGEKSYDIKNRLKLFFCGAGFDPDIPPVRTAGTTNEEGYYRIESASYGTGTTFLAEPMKSFYLHKSVKFTRTNNSNVTLPNFGLPKKSTLELWVNSSGNTGTQTLVSKKSTSNDFKLFLVPSGINQVINITLNGSTHAFGNLGTGFQHLAITIDSTNNFVQVYKNGSSVGSHTFSGSMGNLSESNSLWRLGVHDTGTTLADYYNGLIDEIAVYDTILSPAMINNHYQASRDMQERHLYVYYPMDEGAGDVLSNVGSHFLTNGTVLNGGWSAFAANQEEEPHVFAPRTRQVSLNPSVTSVDQVDFTDRSTISVSGFVRYKDTDCYAPNVEILVNNQSYNPRIFTDSTGKFVVDFDPGFTGTLKPVFEDHAFAPGSWKVTNISSPIAGILFNDQTTRVISGQLAGGLCKKGIIDTNESAFIKLRSVDGCFEKLVPIDNPEGNFEIGNLPPVEKMTVAVIHENPFIDKYFNDLGAPTVNLSKKNDTLEFIYFAQPQIEVGSGLEPYSLGCNTIVMDQYEHKTLALKLKETYIGGICYIDSASFRIINGFNDMTLDTAMSGGILNYEFVVGKPNPSPPFLKTLQIVSTTLEGNKGEYTTQGVVTGIYNKLPTFTTQLPETPSMVLHDPPGDGSYSFIEKGQKICEKMTFSSEYTEGGGLQTFFDFGPDLESIAFFGIPKISFESEVGPDFTILNEISKTSSNSIEVCKTFNSRLSTSEDDLIVGAQGGDVFVGGGLNINFGLADIILFDSTNCQPYDSLSGVIEPGTYGTTFMYTEWHILNTVIPHLITLKSLTTDTTEINRYQTSINRWNKIISDNNKRKINGRPTRNISFSAGADYEYSETIDTITSNSTSEGSQFNGDFDNKIILKFQGIGPGIIIKSHVEKVTESSKDNNDEKGVTTGFVFKDDDVLDAFSVDVCVDSVYKTPLFKVNAGQSSCPWEPGTAKREGVNLVCTNGPVRTDVPANEPATFTFIMGNTSATLETWTYAFTAGPESNKHGAKIFCNGAPMNQIQWYAIPYGTSLPVTVTVERGSVEYDYDSLEIVLYSACEDQRANDLGILPDTAEFLYSAVYVSAHFIRPCSEVVINEPEQNFVIFHDTIPNGNDDVKKVIVSGYSEDPKFEYMILQYRRANGDGTWNAFPGLSKKYNPKWEHRGTLVGPYDTLSHKNYDFFDWNTTGFDDGEYEIRAVTHCSGDAEDKPGYSEIIKGKIDRTPPALVGVPQPSDGVYHVGDEISFTFNQTINCQKFMAQQVGSASLQESETNRVIGITRSCIDNKIILVPTFINEEFENKILRAELFNIEDLTGNKNEHEDWEFYVDRNELAWLTDSIEVVKYVDESKTISAKIHNRGGYPVPYSFKNLPTWVRVYPDRGTLVANEVEEIFFTVDDSQELGVLEDTIILHTETGINPFFMGGDEFLHLKARTLCRPEKWILNPDLLNTAAYTFSMNFIVQLDIEGTMSADESDIVGAYVGNELRGIAKLQYQPSLNKYIAFLTVYSNQNTGEEIKFQIWDASDCKLYAWADESFTFLADDIKGSLSSCIVLHTNSTLLRKIFIHEGWNWISMNLAMSPSTPNAVLSSLSQPVGALIKGQTAFSAYSQNASSWIGTLNSLSPKAMYQYHSLNDDSISLIGQYLDPETQTIPLSVGWNWIGYIPTQAMSINDALSSLQPSSGDIIKSQLHFAQYLAGTGWIGNLKTLNAPNGYLIKLAATDTLVYPDPLSFRNPETGGLRDKVIPLPSGKTEVNDTPLQDMPFAHWTVNPVNYEYTMNLIAIVVESEGSNKLKDGDEVGAFVDGEIRGSGKALYIPALDAYMVFITVYSNKDGETLEFRYYDAGGQQVYVLTEKMDFKINGIIGKADLPVELHIVGLTGTGDLSSGAAFTVFPNPFSGSIQIRYYHSESESVKLTVRDLLGTTIDQKYFKCRPGNNTLEWRPNSQLPGGSYLLQLESETGNHTQKVLYLK